jgi:acyl carrier protein
LQNACVYANLQAIAAWEELQLQPAKFEHEDKITNVHQLLKERGADKPFNLQDSLLSVGLTSLDMTSLVLSIEGEFSVRIPDHIITPANFGSVVTIGRLLRDLVLSSVYSASRPFESPTDRADAAPAGS